MADKNSTESKSEPEKFKLEFLLKSLNESFGFKLATRNPNNIHNFFQAFLGIFPGVLDYEARTITSLTVVTDEMRSNLRAFVSQHEAKLKVLNGVESFISRLSNGDQLFIIPQIKPTQQQSIALHNYLVAEGDEERYIQLSAQTNDMFKDLMEDYLLFPYGAKRQTIGEPIKANRVCRFCGKSMPEVTFTKKAHAISEALGNKTLVLTEECDDCNQKFATTIEPDLIEYFALNRAIYGIKGKGGAKNYEGKNFKIFRDEKLELHYYDSNNNGDPEERRGVDMPGEITLESNKEVAKQNIYRTLVKYALSVIDSSYLKHFTKTIKWINADFDADKLPPVAVFFFDTIIDQPTITLYIRTSEKMEFPFAVAELHFALSKYCFIIPFSDKDDKGFITQETYQVFFDKFKHYTLLKSYATFTDLSDPVSKPFAMRINFEMKNKGE
ncbi:hypothetical protein GCM10027037_05780 [Mucilaginibacter koreensis]